MVVAGEVLRGEHHTAGELGHVSLDPNGPVCACGLTRGCWERAFACNAATIARYTEQVSGVATGRVDRGRRATSGRKRLKRSSRRAMLASQHVAALIAETGKQIGRASQAVDRGVQPEANLRRR